MATEVEPQSSESLEEELHELARDERALKDRLEKSQIAMFVAVGFAVVASIVALVVGLEKSTNTTTVTAPSRAPAPTAPKPVATSRTVGVQLGEMFVRPSATSISAGKVTFAIHNGGQLMHEMFVERAPIKLDGPGKPNEAATIGRLEDVKPGAGGRVTVNLRPGTYELFCNLPGHYAAGQHTIIKVT